MGLERRCKGVVDHLVAARRHRRVVEESVADLEIRLGPVVEASLSHLPGEIGLWSRVVVRENLRGVLARLGSQGATTYGPPSSPSPTVNTR